MCFMTFWTPTDKEPSVISLEFRDSCLLSSSCLNEEVILMATDWNIRQAMREPTASRPLAN
ncbi:hypothetical protein PG996_001979 [Apiospora saccharicola]|uniref:Uncharacterized protein n=1 Tax=Apiospora saccharicola TaxID=335842 RepID=A0ABR1WIB5_9PEZI